MMISKEAQVLKNTLEQNYIPEMDWKSMDFPTLREVYKQGIQLAPLPEGVTWKKDEINKISVERVFVPNASSKIIMHVHGGAMTVGDSSSARYMLAHVGKLCNRNTISVDYRLSPEYAQPAAIEDCVRVYEGLLNEGYKPKEIALLGESAGGALVMSVCAYLKLHKIDMPGCICAISPNVDMEFESASMTRNQNTEICVNSNLKEMMRDIYYKDANPLDPVLSPIHSNLAGWPPVYLHACKDEILLDESVRMYLALENAGVEAELTIVEEMWHTYMMVGLPESHVAYTQIAEFFNRH